MAQTNENFYCIIQQSYLGVNSSVYENAKDKTIKFFFKEYNILDSRRIKKSAGNSLTSDTISLKNPIEKVLTKYDEIINIDDFEKIELLDFKKDDVDKILFEKEVDFIGDSNLDKIEITTSDYEQNGRKPFSVKLYENRDGNLILYKNCSPALWTKPLKLYVSKVKYLKMATLIFISETDGDDWAPENTIKLEMIYADRIEK